MPKQWRTFFEETPPQTFMPLSPTTFDRCVVPGRKNLSKEIYEFLSEDVILIHNKYVKWCRDLGGDFCESICDFGAKHQQLYSLTNIPKFRSFQYRLLQRALVTNIQLYSWGINTDSLCSFCKEQEETLVHLFCECNIVKQIWLQFEQHMKVVFEDVHLNMNNTNIILNEIYPKKNHVVNFLCLITKQYIYRQKCLGKALSFPGLKSIYRNTECIEKYIAVKNQRLAVHNRKWGKGSQNEELLIDFVQRYNQENM